MLEMITWPSWRRKALHEWLDVGTSWRQKYATDCFMWISTDFHIVQHKAHCSYDTAFSV